MPSDQQEIVSPLGENVVPNRWVRFLGDWDWHNPHFKPLGRYTVAFKAGTETRLRRDQFESAIAKGVAVSIPNPRHARSEEASND